MKNKSFLNLLACPSCKKKLFYQDNKLVCGRCKKFFPIKNDIPILLTTEAQDIE